MINRDKLRQIKGRARAFGWGFFHPFGPPPLWWSQQQREEYFVEHGRPWQ